ncbi:hypothetical protein V6X63_10040 [Spiribacter sp. 221]
MSANALAKPCSVIRSAWQNKISFDLHADPSRLDEAIAITMAPPWEGAMDVIEALAEELGITLHCDLQASALPSDKPSKFRREYPLFAALYHSLARAKRAPSEAAGERTRRQILIGLFGRFDGTEVKIYYAQFLEIRRGLERLGPEMPPPHADWRSSGWAVHNAVKAQCDAVETVPAEVKEWLDNFAKLLHGERKVGERLRKGGGRHTGSRAATERLGEQDLHDPEFARRIRSQAGKGRGRGPRPDHADLTPAAPGTKTLSVRTGGISAEATAATSDSEPMPTIEYTEQSTIGPKDGKRIARIIDAQASDNATLSAADNSLLALWRVCEALEVLADEPLDFLYAWLALTTTIDPERLMRLTKSTATPADKAPHFDGEHLAYRLKNGPSALDNDDSNRMVEIALPTRIAHHLRTWGEEKPFAGRRAHVDNRLAHRLGNTPGRTPTLTRLRKTGAYHLERLTGRRTQAQILSGGFNYGQVVPATYRRVPAGKLQGIFAEHTEALAAALLDRSPPGNGLRPWLDELNVRRDITRQPTGSARALEPEAYRPVFDALRSAQLAAQKAIIRAPKHSTEALEAQTEYLRVLTAQTYLAFQLGTGARPIAQRATAGRVGRGVQSTQHAMVFIRDKDSHAFGEARLLPLANDLSKALDHQDAALQHCKEQLQHAGWQVTESPERDRQGLPAWIELPRNGEAAVRVFTNAEFAQVLAAYGIDDPRPDYNATRHTVCTALDQVLDEAHVNAVMGHAGVGGRYFQPESLTSPDLGAIKRALADLLRRAGFRLI